MEHNTTHSQFIEKCIANQNAKLIAQNTNIYKNAFKQACSIIFKTSLFIIPIVGLIVAFGGAK